MLAARSKLRAVAVSVRVIRTIVATYFLITYNRASGNIRAWVCESQADGGGKTSWFVRFRLQAPTGAISRRGVGVSYLF